MSVCFLYSILFMKLWSYVQVNLWCRSYQKQQKTSTSGKRRVSFSMDMSRESDMNGNVMGNGYKDHHPPALVQYPDNLSLRDLFYFLVAPTLCYELNFPRTTRIRKRFLIKRILEVVVGVNIVMALFQQWMIPSVKNSLIPFSNMEFTKATERLLKLAVSEYPPKSNFIQIKSILDSKPLHLALRILLDVPFALQSLRRDPVLRRSKLLLRLVEFEQRRHVLADMEHAGASVVRAPFVHSDGRYGLRQDAGIHPRLLRQCLLPRVLSVGAVEDVQGVGLHGHDGAAAAFAHFKVLRDPHGRALGQRGRVGVAHPRSAALHPRLLPRLCHTKLQSNAGRGGVFELTVEPRDLVVFIVNSDKSQS